MKQTAHKTVVLIHQRLDVKPPCGVKNAPEVRSVLDESGKVPAVLQGHDHPGDYKDVRGAHYVTVTAMIEYFTLEHPPVFATHSPTLLAIGWGIIATWWVGLILSIPAVFVCRLGSRPKFDAARRAEA